MRLRVDSPNDKVRNSVPEKHFSSSSGISVRQQVAGNVERLIFEEKGRVVTFYG